MQDVGREPASTNQDPRTVESKNQERVRESTAIYDVTGACFDAWDYLVSAIDADSPVKQPLSVSSVSSEKSLLDIRSLHNSFAFWVDYTGALAPVEASLDDRLRGHDEIKEMVLELLEMVERNLRHQTVEQNSNGPPTIFSEESQPRLSAIDSALDRLHFLAGAIRKASAKRQEQDIFNFVSDEDKNFHRMAILYVKRECPQARPSLREHMSDHIAGRRRAILQRQRHAEKLKVRREPRPPIAPKPEQRLSTSVEKPAETPSAVLDTSRLLPPAISRAATKASKMDGKMAREYIRQRQTLSIRSSGFLQQGGTMSIEYPDPPQISLYDKYVQCPYCLKPLPAAEVRKKTKSEYWIGHVNQDLQPYVCLFPRCTNSLFAHKSDWSKHMATAHSQDWPRKVHSMTWFCDLGHNKVVEFDNEMDWKDHMRELSLHSSRSKPPNDAQLDALIVRKQQLAPRDLYVCPFCEEKPEKIALLGNLGNPAEMENLLVDHIAEHIKSLSLLSLPGFDSKAAKDDWKSANFAGSSRQRLHNPGSLPQPPSRDEYVEDVLLNFDDIPVALRDYDGENYTSGTEVDRFFNSIPLKDPDFSWESVPLLNIRRGAIDSEFGKWHNHSPPSELADCLRSLAFPEMGSRPYGIDIAEGTCEWLLQDEKYRDWTASNQGMLWIKGVPGSGKSTTLQYAIDKAMISPSIRDEAIVLSFFFHYDGTELQKTPVGLFRSLLHQLLSRIPEALPVLVTILQKRRMSYGWNQQWHTQELQDLFYSSLLKVSPSRPVWLFVDGLYRCGKQEACNLVESFRSLLQELSLTDSQLHICLSCRYLKLYPALDPEFCIMLQNNNKQDISNFARAQLSKLPEEQALWISNHITARASGVFRRARRLVSRQIHWRGLDRSKSEESETSIDGTPPDLGDSYSTLCQGIPKDERSQFLKLIQWICFATRPLSLDELQCAMAIDADRPQQSLRSQECSDSDDHVDVGYMKRKTTTIGRGLVKVIPSHDVPVVQFIHQSVVDFFLEKGLSVLRKPRFSGDVGEGHYQLSRSCIRYLAMEEIAEPIPNDRDFLTSEFPLLHYATTSWTWHVQQTEMSGISPRDLLVLFAWPSEKLLQLWVQIYNILDPDSDNCPLEKTRLIHLAARYQFIGLLRAFTEQASWRTIDVNVTDSLGRTPLLWAAEKGNEVALELLLEDGRADPDLKDSEHGRTPLSWAAGNGHEAVVELLLHDGKVGLNSKDELGRTALHWAVVQGHEAVARLLESAGAETLAPGQA